MSKKEKKVKGQVDDIPDKECACDENCQCDESCSDDCSKPDDSNETELEAAIKEKDMYLDLLKRNQAEFDNFRKRNVSIRADAFNEGKRLAISAMLPLIDNLERAEDAVKSGEDIDALRQGIEMVFKQMSSAITSMGVMEIEAKGKAFNPNLHNAVMQGESDDEYEAGMVMEVFSKGYIMDDKVIRHSMVKVAK